VVNFLSYMWQPLICVILDPLIMSQEFSYELEIALLGMHHHLK
jgi:hypothetical protein